MTTNSRQLQQTWHAARGDVQCNAFKISIGKNSFKGAHLDNWEGSSKTKLQKFYVERKEDG
jgi:hypothetical protein